MLCHLTATSFAVLPPSHDTLTFVDSSSNITRIDCGADEESGVLGYLRGEDQVVVWSRVTGQIKVRATDGQEKLQTTVKNMVQLTRFGDKKYCAYCELEGEGSIVLLEGDSLEKHTVVFKHPRKIRTVKRSDAGPSAYCFDERWNCAVFTRKDTIFIFRRAVDAPDHIEDEKAVFTLKNQDDILSLAATFVSGSSAGELTICTGSKFGKIRVHRVSGKGATKNTQTTEHHWHSGPVNALCLVDQNHLVSGGEEGVIVLWRLDRGSSSMTFRPRLGAAIIAGSVLPWLSSAVEQQQVTPSCLLLLADGSALDVEVPTLVLNRRIRAWIPSNSLFAVPSGVLKQDDSNKYLAVALDNHRPGTLTFIDADLRDSTAEERVLDVAARNAVSTADAASRSRLEDACFSPNGKTIAAIVSTGGKPGTVGAASSATSSRKWELRVLFKEQEVLRVPLALGEKKSDDESTTRRRRTRRILTMTNESIAFADPNARGKILVFKMTSNPTSPNIPSGDFVLQRVVDVDPQVVVSIALSDDESCLACLLKTGAVRVWNRNSGEIVATHSIIGGADSMAAGIGFARGSRELFVWNSHRIDAVLQRATLSFPDQVIVWGTVSPALDHLGFLLKGSKSNTIELFTWNGDRSKGAEPVSGVEPAQDWASAEYCGPVIGWLLQRDSGSLQTRGGKNTIVPKRKEIGPARGGLLPTLQLRKDKASKFAGQVSVGDQPLKKSSIFSTEWCKDLPSHMLTAPPTLEIVWPSWEMKDSATLMLPPKNTKRTADTSSSVSGVVTLVTSSKRQRSSTVGLSTMIVEEETEEQRALLEKAFRGSNGKQ